MPTPTYTPLANVTLGSNTTSITFSSISQAYRDLVIVASGTASTGGSFAYSLYFNGDAGTNYTNVYMYGTGTSAASGTEVIPYIQAMRISSTQSNGIAHIMDYSATDKHKNVLTRGDTADAVTVANAARWANTSAITTILIQNANSGAQMATGTTLSLYGIAA